MNLVQFLDLHGNRLIGSPSDDQSILRILDRFYSVYELANQAIRTGGTLAELATQHLSDRTELYDQVIRERRMPRAFYHSPLGYLLDFQSWVRSPDPGHHWTTILPTHNLHPP